MKKDINVPDLSRSDYYKSADETIEMIYQIVDGISLNTLSSDSLRTIGGHMYFTNVTTLVAIENNLEAISDLLLYYNMSPAYELLRCVRDDFLQTLFLIKNSESESFQKYYDANIKMAENETLEESIKSYHKAMIDYQNSKGKKEKIIDEWYLNEDLDRSDKNVLGYSSYINDLTANPAIETLYNKFFKNEFEKLDKKLNDYVHNNKSTYDTNRSSISSNLSRVMPTFEEDLKIIFNFFISCMFIIKGNLLQSEDYVDYMDAGMNPPDNCQYWIMPWASIYLKLYIVGSDLDDFLKENNPYMMTIETANNVDNNSKHP